MWNGCHVLKLQRCPELCLKLIRLSLCRLALHCHVTLPRVTLLAKQHNKLVLLLAQEPGHRLEAATRTLQLGLQLVLSLPYGERTR